jgi:RNA polymerase sigma-70 factor (ECF subfamily)
MRTDVELLDSYQQTGNQEFFTELYNRHVPHVKNFIRARFMLSQGEAAEMAHDAMATVVMRLDQYDRTKPLGPYINTIAVNAYLDRMRYGARGNTVHLADLANDPLDHRETSPDDLAANSERDVKIKAELGKLPPKYRAILEAKYFQFLSDDDGARSIGLSLRSYRERVKRARRLLGARSA